MHPPINRLSLDLNINKHASHHPSLRPYSIPTNFDRQTTLHPCLLPLPPSPLVTSPSNPNSFQPSICTQPFENTHQNQSLHSTPGSPTLQQLSHLSTFDLPFKTHSFQFNPSTPLSATLSHFHVSSNQINPLLDLPRRSISQISFSTSQSSLCELDPSDDDSDSRRSTVSQLQTDQSHDDDNSTLDQTNLPISPNQLLFISHGKQPADDIFPAPQPDPPPSLSSENDLNPPDHVADTDCVIHSHSQTNQSDITSPHNSTNSPSSFTHPQPHTDPVLPPTHLSPTNTYNVDHSSVESNLDHVPVCSNPCQPLNPHHVDRELATPRVSTKIDGDRLGLQIHLPVLEPISEYGNFSLMSPSYSDLISQLDFTINSLADSSSNESKPIQSSIISPHFDDHVSSTPRVAPNSLWPGPHPRQPQLYSSPSPGAKSSALFNSNSPTSRNHDIASSSALGPRRQLLSRRSQHGLTLANNSTDHPHDLKTQHVHSIRTRMTRAISLPTSSSILEPGIRIRHRRQSSSNINSPPTPKPNVTSDNLTDLSVLSCRKNEFKTKPESLLTASRPETTLNCRHPSHLSRLCVSMTRPTSGRASKFSLLTANMDGVVLVPSNGQRVGVAPITNVSMMPLYLVQPFLSPNSSVAPATPALRAFIRSPHSSFPTRSSFPITPSSLHPPHENEKFDTSSKSEYLLEKIIRLNHHFKKMMKFNKFLPFIGPPSDAEGRIPRTRKDFSIQRNQLSAQAGDTKIFSDRYCCFAIPLYNAGIYSILAQFTACGFIMGVLSFFSPSILAIAIDSSFAIFFGVLCLTIGLVQSVGFYAVYKEKPDMFKKYFMVNSALLTITLSYSLILLIVSSTKHETAVVQCLVQFVSNDEFLDGPSDTSREVCSIWTYLQLGVCFFVWILFLVSELYFCYMVKVWGKEQTLDHITYKSIISAVRQSMTASSLHAGGLDGENDWESHSRLGSLDLPSELGSPRGSRYSNNHGRSGSSTLINGHSRLKNEIVWKELGVVENKPEFQTSEKEDEFSRKGKFKEPEIDEEIIQLGGSSGGNSESYGFVSTPSRHAKGQHQQQKPVLGNWIESMDIHDPSSLTSSPFSDAHRPASHHQQTASSPSGYQNPFTSSNLDNQNSSSPPLNSTQPSHRAHQIMDDDDDQIYYKSPKPPGSK